MLPGTVIIQFKHSCCPCFFTAERIGCLGQFLIAFVLTATAVGIGQKAGILRPICFVLSSAAVVGIAPGPGKAHLQVLAGHIGTNKLSLSQIVFKKLVDCLSRLPGQCFGAKAPVGQEFRFIGFYQQNTLLAYTYAVQFGLLSEISVFEVQAVIKSIFLHESMYEAADRGLVVCRLCVFLNMLRPYYQTRVVEAGCDEAGRGCLAGPVVAGAVVLPADFYHPLLNDSKQLRPEDRQLLAPIIKAQALAWAVAVCSPAEIDQHNILQASLLAMHRAVDQLALRPELLLIDGNRFKPYPFVPHLCVVKGDSIYASIAAASVLAKTHRDTLMEALAREHPRYGWERNMGYPTPEHKAALLQWGPTPWHRQSFKGVKEHTSLSN
jgi:ribonuclease HII